MPKNNVIRKNSSVGTRKLKSKFQSLCNECGKKGYKKTDYLKLKKKVKFVLKYIAILLEFKETVSTDGIKRTNEKHQTTTMSNGNNVSMIESKADLVSLTVMYT